MGWSGFVLGKAEEVTSFGANKWHKSASLLKQQPFWIVRDIIRNVFVQNVSKKQLSKYPLLAQKKKVKND
jgi:hypothetical protein